MYRFLIIDDEPVVREGIATNIDWNAHGFELVGACRDGREGLRAVEELHPDVVLTDICMPFVDGLELAAYVAEQYPAIRTMLLTGYDEFEYAQEAIKLRVKDFLLKPITAAELREHLDSVRLELDAERDHEQQLDRIRKQLHESLPILRERFLNRLIHAAPPPAVINERLQLLELVLSGPVFVCLVCDPDRLDSSAHLTELAVQEDVGIAVDSVAEAVSFATPQESIVVIVSGATAEEAASRALECAEAISERVVRQLGVTVSVGIGEPVDGAAEIPSSYAGARTAIEHRLVLGPNQIITGHQVRGVQSGPFDSTERECREVFVQGMKSGRREESERALSQLIQIHRSNGTDVELCHAAIHRLLADSLNALDLLGVNYADIPALGSNPFEQIGHLKTLSDIQEWFHSFVARVGMYLESRRSHHSSHKATEAEEFIRRSFARKDLSLSTVCRELSVSKSYFSPLFKAHTGMTFVEYLTAIRITRAKELLVGTDLRNYEIAERVGFSDPHYFSLSFKKQTGLPPTEYRERNGPRVEGSTT